MKDTTKMFTVLMVLLVFASSVTALGESNNPGPFNTWLGYVNVGGAAVTDIAGYSQDTGTKVSQLYVYPETWDPNGYSIGIMAGFNTLIYFKVNGMVTDQLPQQMNVDNGENCSDLISGACGIGTHYLNLSVTDADGDGYAPGYPGYAVPGNDGDCDDNPLACGADCNPGILNEGSLAGYCSDGYDNDCDGLVDINDTDCDQCWDNDGDGYNQTNTNPLLNCGPADCDDSDNSTWTNTTLLYYDGDDDDYHSTSGYICIGNSYPAGYQATTSGLDCDDTNQTINPSAGEFACDGVDNNCNGQIDEGYPNYDGDSDADCVDTDDDNDGVIDRNEGGPDNVFGNCSRLINDLADPHCYINGVENINTTEGVSSMLVTDGNLTIIQFNFNVSTGWDWSYVDYDQMSSNDSDVYGAVELEITNFETGELKNVTFKKYGSIQSVCVLDKQNALVSEITDACLGTDETPVDCPGVNGQYTCSVVDNGTRFMVTGLSHSAVKQQYYCGDGIKNTWELCDGTNTTRCSYYDDSYNTGSPSCSATCSQSVGTCRYVSASTGGGGSYTPTSCDPEWECTVYGTCVDGVQTRTCSDANDCNNETGRPAESRSCTVAGSGSGEEGGNDFVGSGTTDDIGGGNDGVLAGNVGSTSSSTTTTAEPTTTTEEPTGLAALTGAFLGERGKVIGIGGLILLLLIIGTLVAMKYMSQGDGFTQASRYHKKAEKAYRKGNSKKAEKFYNKAQVAREAAESKLQ